MHNEQRLPDQIISWKTYTIPLNDVVRAMAIPEPVKSSREVEIKNGALVITIKSIDGR